MSKKNNSNRSIFIYNFIFFLGLNAIVNFLCRYISSHNLLFPNPVIRLSFVHNTGAAFNLFESRIPFLIAVGVLALIYIIHRVYISENALNKASAVGFSLMTAGIVHNMYERVCLGYVQDYFDLNFINFPIFNMADVLITCGAILLISQILVKKL